MQHTVFKQRMFAYKGQQSTIHQQMIAPFNVSYLFEPIQESDHEFFKDNSIYYQTTGRLTLNPSYGVTKSISRLITILTNPRMGFGGFGLLKDGTVVADYFDDRAEKYNLN